MTIQLLCAFVIAFLFVTAFGKWYIPWLEKEKARQQIKTELTQHSGKRGTPTMGGVMFILAVILVCLTLGFPGMLQGHYEHIFVLLFALVLFDVLFTFAWCEDFTRLGLVASSMVG